MLEKRQEHSSPSIAIMKGSTLHIPTPIRRKSITKPSNYGFYLVRKQFANNNLEKSKKEKQIRQYISRNQYFCLLVEITVGILFCGCAIIASASIFPTPPLWITGINKYLSVFASRVCGFLQASLLDRIFCRHGGEAQPAAFVLEGYRIPLIWSHEGESAESNISRWVVQSPSSCSANS